MDPEALPLPTLISAVYRLRRYHTAKAGAKVQTVGFSGLSCVGCDEEMKRERGCRLPGYTYTSELLWRVDYHEPLTAKDRALFCPASLLTLAPEVVDLVDEALEIKAEGLAAYSGDAPAQLPAWYNEAYRMVRDASARAQQEVDATALALSVQLNREKEARSKWG